MKSVLSIVALAMIACAGVAQADLLPQQTEVTITGADATKIADLLTTSADKNGIYAQGTAKISCVQKTNETNFTCIVKVVNDAP